MKVAIVVFDGVQALDVAGPMDVFAEANTHLPDHRKYQVALVGAQAGYVTCSNGMQLSVPFGYTDFDVQADLLIVAGGPKLPDYRPRADMLKWLQSQTFGATRFGSVCNGAFVLGHAGLLDGKQATTHWAEAARLADDFPHAHVQPDRIFTRDGRLFTSAGVTAGIDLALALVREDHGAEVARGVAKRLVVMAQRQGGQSQFSPFLTMPADETSPIARVQAHVLAHIGERFTIERLAAIAGTSSRHLARLFVKEAGMTPHEFIDGARVDVARNLLEGTSLPFKAVAYDCGFGTADRMRLVFARRLGISPAQYRAGFQAGS
jgi:transcriptional regulator GlxA family with amidase domain